MQNILKLLYQGDILTQKQCQQFIYNVINKKLTPIQIGAALISMKIRGEATEEIIEIANVLLAHAKPFPRPSVLFADLTGTGGDEKNTINISTISAIVASTCGINIIKHGNYSASNITGSMDLLKRCYIDTNNVERQIKNFDKLGICFVSASEYHPILQDIMFIRRELKTATLFNIVGPLINPAKPTLSLIGVYKQELQLPMVESLKFLNYNHAIVVHCDGIDEVGLHSATNIYELYNGCIKNYRLIPSDFGLDTYPIQELYCSSRDAAYNDMINLLQGSGKPAHNAVIAANVALFLKLFGYNNLKNNVSMILKKISSGEPYTKMLSLSRSS